MQFTKKQKVAAALAGGAIAVAGGGVAFAYWSTSGSGSDSGTAASSNGTVTYHSSFVATTLAPGTSVPVSYSATNDTSASDLSINNPLAKVSSNKTVDGLAMASDFANSCAQYLSLSGQPTQGVTVVPHGGASVALGSANIVFANDATHSQDLCKGQTVTVSITSS